MDFPRVMRRTPCALAALTVLVLQQDSLDGISVTRGTDVDHFVSVPQNEDAWMFRRVFKYRPVKPPPFMRKRHRPTKPRAPSRYSPGERFATRSGSPLTG